MREEGRPGQRKRTHLDEQWNARFKELLSYRSEHGNCDVPARQGMLGSWVASQRKAYMAVSLAQNRIDRLGSIGFSWALKGPEVPWGTRFNELVQYKAKHGNCNVPQKQGTLGTWVCSQRVAYKAGSLAQGRIDRLNSIGFSWVMAKGGSKGDWETRFKELVQYKTKHGDCNIPFRQGQLGGWVGRQRNTHKEGKLSHDRIDRLNAIGFD